MYSFFFSRVLCVIEIFFLILYLFNKRGWGFLLMSFLSISLMGLFSFSFGCISSAIFFSNIMKVSSCSFLQFYYACVPINFRVMFLKPEETKYNLLFSQSSYHKLSSGVPISDFEFQINVMLDGSFLIFSFINVEGFQGFCQVLNDKSLRSSKVLINEYSSCSSIQ